MRRHRLQLRIGGVGDGQLEDVDEALLDLKHGRENVVCTRAIDAKGPTMFLCGMCAHKFLFCENRVFDAGKWQC